MSDNGENLEAFITFKADAKQLTSTVETSMGKIAQLGPAAGKAESSIKKVWATKNEATGLHGAIDKTAKEFDKISHSADKAHSSSHKFFKDLKASGGRRSALGESIELFRGGGAIMAVTMLGEALSKASEKAAELDKQLREGEMDAAGMAVAFGKSLPLIGGFVDAGQNIRGIIERHATGFSTQDEVDRIKEDTALGDKISETRQKANKQVKESRRQGEDKAEDVQGKLDIMSQITERGRQKVTVDVEFKSSTRGIKEGLEKEVERRKEELTEEVKAINETYKNRLTDSSTMSTAERATYTDDALKAIDNEAHKSRDMKDAKIRTASSSAASDIKQLEKAAEDATKAMDRLHDKAVEDITGIAKEMRELKFQTDLVGKSELDKYTMGLQHSGLEKPELIDELAVQKAKEIGAILKESLMTPMDKYTKENADLAQLLDKGGIDQQTYMQGMMKNAHEMLSSVKTNSVEGMFLENIKNRFIDQGINTQLDDLRGQAAGQPNDENHKVNVKWEENSGPTAENTKAVEGNTEAQQKALDAMADLGKALMNAKNKAVFGD